MDCSAVCELVYNWVLDTVKLLVEVEEDVPCSDLVPILFVADVDPDTRGVPETYGLPVNVVAGLADCEAATEPVIRGVPDHVFA